MKNESSFFIMVKRFFNCKDNNNLAITRLTSLFLSFLYVSSSHSRLKSQKAPVSIKEIRGFCLERKLIGQQEALISQQEALIGQQEALIGQQG
jgi:hypothetical protein